MTQRLVLHTVPLVALMLWVFPAQADDNTETQALSAKDDYITCWKQPCVLTAGSTWSWENPNGVAISVRMGTQPIVTDDEIKYILTNDFKYYGVINIQFFFEQNDAVATGVAFHVRGGSDGVYRVTQMRERVAELAARAKNENPLFSSAQ